MTFPIIVELGVGTDGGWVDVTDRLRGDEVAIERGRADENAGASPTQTSLLLDNSDGQLTPGDARSSWYPNVKRGMPVRISKPGGPTYLASPGTPTHRAVTSDHASFDVGDLWVAAEIGTDWETTNNVSVLDRWVTAGNQRSFGLYLETSTRLGLIWSPNGTSTMSWDMPFVPVTSDGRMAIGVHLDVDDGAGGHVITFYVGRTLDDLMIVGDPHVGTGTTAVHPGTAPIAIGAQVFGGPPFRCYRAEVRNGDPSGALVVAPDFTAQAVGTTSFVDAAGRTWTVEGDAEIADVDVRFLGQADKVEMNWPLSRERGTLRPQSSRVTVDASVSLRRMLQGTKPLASTLRRFLSSPGASDVVVDYWPFEDGRDATVISSGLPAGAPMSIRKDFTMAADDTLPASSPLMSVASGENAYMAAPIRQAIPQVPGVQWEVTRFFRIDDPAVDPAFTQLLAVDTNGRVATWRISINDVGVFISGRDSDAASVVSTSFASDPRFFDTWAMIILEVVDDGVNVDWAVSLIPIPLGSVFGTSGTFVGNTGVPSAFRNSLTGPPSGVSVGHLIVTSGAPIGWLAGADTAWVGETAAHRFWRLLEEEGVPASIIGDPNVRLSLRGDPSLSELMGPQRPAPLLDLLQECVAADGGRLIERRDKVGLCYRTRHTLYNQTAAVALDAAAAGLRREPFAPTLDDQAYRNEITASRPDGGSVTLTTDPAPDPGDLYDDSVDVNVAADTQLGDQAGWRLHLGSTETLRYPGLATSMGRSGAGVAWSEAEVGDKVTVTNLPDQLPVNDEILIEGSREVFDFFRWIVEVNGSPAGPWTVGVYDDVDLARYDTAGSELAADLTETGINVFVITTLGPEWTLEAADYPMLLNVGGEQIRANGGVIFGTHLFTPCDRSLNGVVRAHPIGTPVRLWRPTVRAL